MASALHTVRHVSWRTRTSSCSLLEAVGMTPCRCANATTSASKHQCGVPSRSATYHVNPSSASSAAISKVLPLGRTVPKQQRHYCCSLPRNRPVVCDHSPGQSPAALAHSFYDAAAGMTRSGRIGQRCSTASVGSIRKFGGQSVVPWELALFLVDEMKGEMVQPGAVVYTAALAECRWAGEQRHVDYILKEMKAEGLNIVPGIPGATNDDPPPSQSPPLFGKLPEPPPNSATPQHQPGTGGPDQHAAAAAVVEKMQEAARTAEAALATVETMWARAQHDPSPATCRAALDACAAGGQWERALSLVRDAAAAVTVSAGPGASVPSDRTEGEEGGVPGRVEALALEGRWDDALLLVQGKACSSEGGGDGVEEGNR
ncbi:unnamed protein product [Ectocarpus sp. CCAP 1310/34]|nr:unnamed protein product [Ectocarpus sp. CCAP 1310/34]